MNKEVWNQVKSNLYVKNYNNPTFNALLESLNPVDKSIDSSEAQIKFTVPTRYHKNLIKDHIIIDQIKKELSKFYQSGFQLELKIETLKKEEKVPSKQLKFNQIGFFTSLEKLKNNSLETQQTNKETLKKEPLRNDFTFNTFVVGPNNEFAHAASFQASENPGELKYNPLFVFGPTGLGKTHLLNAIGNHIKQKKSQTRVVYISAESFLKECVTALRYKKMDSFQEKYRENADVLLVDDIHTLGRGTVAQEEFFHVLNSLLQLKKQIVVACDRMPKELNGLEDRIQTRLEGGLIVSIEIPDLETKMAILRYKSEAMSLNISNEIIQYLASISNRSIRELEGNLNKVRMFSQLQGLSISIDMVKRVLNHNESLNTLTTEKIQKIVSDAFNIKLTDLKSKNRQKQIVTARQIAMKLIQKYLKKTLKDIGRAFGGKDHSTVLNNIKKIDFKLSKDSELMSIFNKIESSIHKITPIEM